MTDAWRDSSDHQEVADELANDQLSRVLASMQADSFDRLLETRIIVLDGAIDVRIADRICGQLLVLSAVDATRDVTLYVRSPGGSVDAALTICDTMRYVSNDVAILIVGMAAAAGQFIASAGTKHKRRALSRSRIRIHSEMDGIETAAADPVTRAEQMIHTKRIILAEAARLAGRPISALGSDGELDRWLTPEEAVDCGLIDEVIPVPWMAPNGEMVGLRWA